MHNSPTVILQSVFFFQSLSCIMNEADPPYSSSIVNRVFDAFSAYTAIMLNILTIHAIRKTSSLPKPFKTLLLSIAVSDLGVGFLAQPLYIAWIVRYVTFNTFYVIQLIFTIPSFFTVVATSVDRFLAIHLHLRYKELATHKRVLAVVISIWTLSLLFPPLICCLNSKKPVNAVMIVFFPGLVVLLLWVLYLFRDVFHCTLSYRPNSSPSSASSTE